MGGDLEDILHDSSVWRNLNGNRNVVCLNRNDAKRNANLNNFDNDWNDNWRFAAVRNSLYFPLAFDKRVFIFERSERDENLFLFPSE
jgi:hypothetical protein